ncbi:sensor histidine kinase [Rudanella lutea]|uniref:sensor histidine kinase n=1 Tax=Rudanella lutea TaxID=451374 RepID=UPI000375F39E|nr:histidine kinase [Rudanella lutea]
MKIRINRNIQLAFLYLALLGVLGRQWVLPSIGWKEQAILFGVTLLIFNAILLFHYWFNEYLNRRYPFERNVRNRVIIQLIVGWGVVKTVLFLGGLLIVRQILPALTDSINRLTLVALSLVAFLANTVICLSFIAILLFNRWQENLLRAARLEQEKAQVQYDNLKNQLNPHFLFNSLSSLDSLIDDNPVLARQFLQQLARVYRYVLQHKDKELVTLETELAFIKNYVALLQTRFEGTFRLDCTVESETLERQIVPVTLQILIENAIKHNIISEAAPLTVDLRVQDGYLEVSNRIQRKKQIATSNGQGLQNLQQLYSFLSDRTIEIQEDKTTFRVRVPLL